MRADKKQKRNAWKYELDAVGGTTASMSTLKLEPGFSSADQALGRRLGGLGREDGGLVHLWRIDMWPECKIRERYKTGG
jgi:hypothetical protein